MWLEARPAYLTRGGTIKVQHVREQLVSLAADGSHKMYQCISVSCSSLHGTSGEARPCTAWFAAATIEQ